MLHSLIFFEFAHRNFVFNCKKNCLGSSMLITNMVHKIEFNLQSFEAIIKLTLFYDDIGLFRPMHLSDLHFLKAIQ